MHLMIMIPQLLMLVLFPVLTVQMNMIKSIVKYGRVMMESFPLLVTIKSDLMAEEDIKLHTKAKIIL